MSLKEKIENVKEKAWELKMFGKGWIEGTTYSVGGLVPACLPEESRKKMGE